MKKETIIAVLATIVGAFLILMVIGLTTKEEPIKETAKEESRRLFMGGCVDDGLYEFCDCSFEKLYNTYGEKGIQEIGVEYEQTNEIPSRALETVASCFGKVSE